MELDSVAAIQKWADLRETILFDEMSKLSGRLVSGAGDAVLLEFTSVTDAARWALGIQLRIQELPERNFPMQVRVGLNIDDVVDDGETLQSDGIVVAARIQHLASAGEIMVTQSVRDILRSKLDAKFRDLGAPILKNIDRPVRVFALEAISSKVPVLRPHANWNARPTVAIMPFQDHGAPLAERYFGEGITEDIITGIARSRALFVVARTSTTQVSGKGLTMREKAEALGVKYLVTGSIRRMGQKLRIHTELVEVDRNRAIWVEQFDGDLGDLFEFQDQIVASIVAVLEPKVLQAETANLRNRPTESLDAYDCVLRALSELYKFTGDSYTEARALLERAIALDPNYAQAHAYLAWCLNFLIAEGHTSDQFTDRTRAVASARRAVELDPEDPLVLSIRGHLMSLVENLPEEALDLFDQAIDLNANLPLAWGLSATTYAYLGDGDEARDRLLNVWRLTPLDPLNFFFLTAAGLGEFVAGRYDPAIKMLQRARRTKPHFMAALRLLAASLALSGRKDEAGEIAERILQEAPGFSTTDFLTWYPLRAKEPRQRLRSGLRLAGLPE